MNHNHHEMVKQFKQEIARLNQERTTLDSQLNA